MTLQKNYKDQTSSFFYVLQIVAETDARKLLFYGLSSNALAKKKFLTRLVYSFLYDLARTQFAFIPEILQNSRFVWIHELLTKLATGRQNGLHGGKSLSRSTNTQPTLSLQIYFLSRDQLQTSEQYRIFPRQWFLIRSSLHSEAEQKLLTWEDDNRSSIQQSDTSYMNIKHFNCYVTIYLNVYLIFIYLLTCLSLFSLYVHMFSSSCIHSLFTLT